jgi:hypothetical protein
VEVWDGLNCLRTESIGELLRLQEEVMKLWISYKAGNLLKSSNIISDSRRPVFHGVNSLTHGAEPFLRNHQLCSYSRTSQNFIEPEGSLQYSQEPSTGPYPEPDQSNPSHLILYLKDPF